jgi:hypothetical protein
MLAYPAAIRGVGGPALAGGFRFDQTLPVRALMIGEGTLYVKDILSQIPQDGN